MLVIAIIGGILNNIGTTNMVKASENDKYEIKDLDALSEDGMEEAALIDSQEVSNCVVNDIEKEVSEVISYKVDGSRCISKVATTQIDKIYYNANDELVYTETINFNDTHEDL